MSTKFGVITGGLGHSTDDALYTGVEQANPEGLRLYSELEASRYFVRQHGERIRYCERASGWHVYDGKRWLLDRDGAIFRLAKESVDRIAETIDETRSEDERKRLRSFTVALSRRRTLRDVVALAESELPCAIGDPAAFDADPHLLNAKNGAVDLRTGELLPHDPGRLMTKLVPIAYEPNATCPRWLRFLDEVFAGDQNLIAFLRRGIGYSLTGSTREQCFFILHGSGKNGKSTFLKALRRISGDYHVAADAGSFVDRKPGQASNDIARLAGARSVTAIESDDNQRLAENLIKSLTGGDAIAVRFLYAEYFEFVPAFKWWLASNHRPTVKGTDEGIWRRIRLVPFTQQFTPDDDPALDETLEAEMPGILAWAVAGAVEWHQSRLGSAEAVAKATSSYRTDMDAFGDFIAEQCLCAPTAVAGAGDLFAAYRQWAEASGEKPVTQRWFGLRLRERGFRESRDRTGRKRWIGIGLKSDGMMNLNGIDEP